MNDEEARVVDAARAWVAANRSIRDMDPDVELMRAVDALPGSPQVLVETLEARRALIRETRIDGYLQAADDLEDHGPAAVRAEAKRLREGYYRDDS